MRYVVRLGLMAAVSAAAVAALVAAVVVGGPMARAGYVLIAIGMAVLVPALAGVDGRPAPPPPPPPPEEAAEAPERAGVYGVD